VSRVRLTINMKFLVVLAAVLPLLVVVLWVAVAGLATVHSEIARVAGDNVRTSLATTDLGGDLSAAESLAMQFAAARDPLRAQALSAELDEQVAPRIDAEIPALQALHAHDAPAEAVLPRAIATGWGKFEVLEQRWDVKGDGLAKRSPTQVAADTAQVAAIFDPLIASTRTLTHREASDARATELAAQANYRSNLWIIVLVAGVTLLAGLLGGVWLIRSVARRARAYSRFATHLAAGDLSGTPDLRGNDELSDLGVALGDLVSHQVADRGYRRAQDEFAETLQVSDTEHEAHELLRDHLERMIPQGRVVVLNRNNSADRLEATTALPEDSIAALGLKNAKPRSCLAVRFARTHAGEPGVAGLVRCAVCGDYAESTTCEPLLVGGEVIGSVLVVHPEPLARSAARAISDSVVQAAPVLANLRNLAIAENRAATDALTGLPNKRSVDDALKRMVAGSARSAAPLSMIMLDLDRFKQINDTYGHGSGDDVLAAAGAALSTSIRASDFAGRYGGEEFVILLAATDNDGALASAEKIRAAIAAITVPTVGRAITASLGLATFPHDATDATDLLRAADRALYSAKRNGRNRVETVATTDDHEPTNTHPHRAT
jgi:diguanylate cyclase (GGDEF)-like protein